jgi:hypothetical protein
VYRRRRALAAIGSRDVPPATSKGQPGFNFHIVASSCSWTSPVTRAAASLDHGAEPGRS